MEFPDDAEKDKAVRNAINVIRLITRIIFVWFLKEKGLVPDSLFIKSRIDNILNYTDKTGSTFYKAILQNLFFATLNTEMNKDKPGNRIFVNRQYGITNLYRYERFFKDKDKALALFENIPFLNGGLFECLDKNTGSTEIRIDCFSNRRDNETRLTVPDYLFFNPEGQIIDLSDVYGDKRRKSERVRGLIDILDSYKFTVDENTPIEEEIALDPELLGKVFENLLASYNPETQTTARKQTGSFYTPREIVNYMVDESIIAYLANALDNAPALSGTPSLAKRGEGELGSHDARLRHLIAYNDDPHKFTSDEVDVLIAAINTLKALDPACGSGAFPMGMLHKLVYILGKLDPDNSKWRELQRQKAIRETEEAYNIGDKEEREKRLLDISEVFENNASDYGRKLYLIENCIFGVDIQPIAVQIAKLRFFVSLIVDQRIDPKKENLGVRPLPNLETKFVAANTLIGIEKPEQMLLRNPEIDRKEKELKEVRERHFTARTPQTKEKYRKADERLRAEISELLKNDGFPRETTEKLAKWNPYDQNASADFFDSEWMFGITNGFDVVIGNPPYVDSETMTRDNPEFRATLRTIYSSTRGNWDLFVPFVEKGMLLLRRDGIFSYIIPNKLIGAKYTETLRELLLSQEVIEIRDYSNVDVFKEAAVYPITFVIRNKTPITNVLMTKMLDLSNIEYLNRIDKSIFYKDIYWDKYFGQSFNVSIVTKVTRNEKLSKYFPNVIGSATVNEAYKIKEFLVEEGRAGGKSAKKFVNTGTIDKYCSTWGIEKTRYIKQSYSKPVITISDLKSINPTRLMQANSPKVIIAGMAKQIEAFYDNGDYLAGKSTTIILGNQLEASSELKILAAILNSKLISFWFSCFYNSLSMAGGYFNIGTHEINNIPIASLSKSDKTEILAVVDQILSGKKKDPNTDTSALERQIDKMVYKLYGLTDEEIGIVEGKR